MIVVWCSYTTNNGGEVSRDVTEHAYHIQIIITYTQNDDNVIPD